MTAVERLERVNAELSQRLAAAEDQLRRLSSAVDMHVRDAKGMVGRDYPHPFLLVRTLEVPVLARVDDLGFAVASNTMRTKQTGVYWLDSLVSGTRLTPPLASAVAQTSAETASRKAVLVLAATKDGYSRASVTLSHDVGQMPRVIIEPSVVLQGLTGDPPSPQDGEMWYRSDLGQLRVRVGGSTYRVSLTAV